MSPQFALVYHGKWLSRGALKKVLLQTAPTQVFYTYGQDAWGMVGGVPFNKIADPQPVALPKTDTSNFTDS